MSQEETNNLSFGDKIVIKGLLDRGQQVYQGFLCGKGYTQTKISFQVIPSDILQKSSETGSNLNFVKNYSDFVFQIWPRLNFQASKELRHIVKRLENIQKRIDKLTRDSQKRNEDGNPDQTMSKSQLKKHAESDGNLSDLQRLQEEKEYTQNQKELLKEKVEKEKENNINSLQQFQGQPVGYGSEIQIMHLDSGLFLSSQTLASDSEKSAYSFLLSEDYSSGMIFRILPKYKLRNIGDTIQYRDQVIIQNIKLRFSVSFSEDQAIKGNQQKNENNKQGKDYKQIQISQLDPTSFIVDTYISQYTEVVWEFRKFAQSTVENNKAASTICGGEFVRFLHTESGGYLNADIPYNNPSQPEVHLSTYKGTFESEKLSVSQIWQIELTHDYNRGVPFSIGTATESNSVYLRHVQTGKLLQFSKGQFYLLDDSVILNESNAISCQFQFAHTKFSDNHFLENLQCYHMSAQKNYINITTEPEQTLENNAIERLPGFYASIEDSELNLTRQKITGIADINDENALQIERISGQEKQDLLFTLSAQTILIRFVNIFKHNESAEHLTPILIKRVSHTLEKLIHFSCQLEEDSDLFDCEGFSIESHQKLLKDTSFIQMLTNLLYYPFQNKFYDSQSLQGVPKEIIHIFKLSYVLIKLIIREYRPNELFASQWLELLMIQAMEYDNEVDILAEPTLTELIDNNEAILKKKIDTQMIEKFVSLLIKERSTKYIKLLRALINCNGNAMKVNQEIIINKLIVDNPEVKSVINPLMMTFDGKIQITIEDIPYEMDTIQEQKLNEVVEYMEYYTNLILLFSDLCMDKQFVAIEKLREYFTYDICFTIISSTDYSKELKSAFSSFMKTCFIEGQHMQEIQAPVYLKEWDKVYSQKEEAQWLKQQQQLQSQQKLSNSAGNSQLKRYHPTFTENPDIIQCEFQLEQFQLEQFDKLKNFIKQYMNEITGDKQYQRVWQSETNEFTLNIIKLCKSLFSYGLYNSILSINEILIPLIKFLNATRDLATQAEEKALKFGTGSSVPRSSRSTESSQDSSEQKNMAKKANRYAKTEENIILSESRTCICEILELVNNIVLNWMGDKILISFKKYYELNQMANLNILDLVKIVRERMSYEKQLEELDPHDKDNAQQLAQLKKCPPFDIFELPLQWINERVNDTYFQTDSIIQKKNFGSKSQDKIINLYLIDLILYDNAELVKSSLQILESNFSKRVDLVQYLKDIQIVDDAQKTQILQKSRDNFIRLNNLVDETENWYALNNQRGEENSKIVIDILDQFFLSLTDSTIVDALNIDEALSDNQDKKINGQDDIDEGDEEVKDQDELIFHPQQNSVKGTPRIHDEILSEDSIMNDKLKKLISSDVNQQPIDINANYYHEFVYRRNIRPEIQKMFRLLQIHKPLIELILNDLSQIKKEEKNQRQTILKKCFRVLSLFCFENILNQQQILPYLDSIIEHLALDVKNIPQILLNEIIRSNEEVLFDYNTIHKVIDNFASTINDLDLNDPQRPVFLDYMSTSIKCKNSIIRSNQIEVMISLSNPKYKQILFLLNIGSKEEHLFITHSNELSQLMEKALKQNDQPITIPIPFILQYFNQQLDVMSIACEEKNDATESKSQNFFPLELIFDILSKTQYCWPIRKTIIQFFFHVYLETEKDIEEMDYIQKIMLLIQADLEYISNNIQLFMNSKIQLSTFQGSTPLRSLIQVYVFGVLLFCVKESANRSLINSKEVVGTFYKSVLQSFVKIQTILTEKDEENKLFLAQIFYLVLQKKHIPKKSVEINNIREQLLPEIQDSIKRYENQTINLATFDKNEKEELEQFGNQKSISQKFHIIFSTLEDTSSFQQQTEKEFEHLTSTMKGIQYLSKRGFKNVNTITFEQLCKQFGSIINADNSVLSEDQFLLGLRIFRKFIEGENQEINKPAADWEGETEFENQIVHKQNLLAEYGVMQVVCNFLKSHLSRELKNEAILLGIAMLYGGNLKCQEALFECLQQDQSNSVMVCLFEMIDQLSSKIKKPMSKRNQQFTQKFRQQIDDIKSLQKADTIGVSKVEDIAQQKKEQQEHIEKIKEQQEQELLLQEIQHSYKIYDEDDMIQNLTRIYRLLQLFCEGHFLPLQDYLREQKQNGDLNPKSINFIKLISQYFGGYIRYMNDKTVGVGQQMIDLLVESVQGPCQLNQKCISDNRIVDHIKELISNFSQSSDYEKRGLNTHELKDEVNEVVSKSTLLLVSLLEGNTEKEIPLYIDQQLDYSFIRSFLANQYSDFVTESLELKLQDVTVADVIDELSEFSQTFTGQIEMAFNMYILIATISDQLKRMNPEVESEAQKCLNLKTENLEDHAMEFFNKNTCNIEVFFQEKICRVFFIMQPACRNISKKSREQFMNEVDRGTLNDKLGSLMAESDTFITEMDHMTNLKGWVVHFTSQRFHMLKLISTLLAFVINIVMVAVFERTVETNNSVMDTSSGGSDVVIYVLGIIQLIINLVMMIFWLIINVPVILTQKWAQFTQENEYLVDSKMEALLEDLGHPKYFPTYLTTYALKTKGPHYSKFQENSKLRLGSIWGYVKYYESSFMFLMKDATFLYLFFYIACSILGFFFNNIIYSFQLLDIINQFPTLRNVTLAVQLNADQLLKTFLLGVIVIFIYSVIGYTFATDSYFFGDVSENLCSNLFHCFLESLNLGLRNGGGIGDSMRVESFEYSNRAMFIFRVIFDVTFFACINVVFINIIFGIIIDTFAELRDQKSEVAKDMKNICFICGLERYTFDKNTDGFQNHIERDHQLWNYIFYVYFLSKKDATDFNGIETSVFSKIENEDISWFPMMKAISLGEQEDKNELTDKVIENLDDMNTQFKELQDKVNFLHTQLKKEQQLQKKVVK